MSIATSRQKENLAVEYAAQATQVSLHTADPGTTGTSEATGGSPAYARKVPVWTAGSMDGSIVTQLMVFDVPAGTYTYAGLWDGTNFLDKVAIGSHVRAAQGTLSVRLTYVQS